MKRLISAIVILGVLACAPLAVDEYSAFALASGNQNFIFGASCALPVDVGHQACQITRGSKMPKLTMIFMNEASYAVSDCRMGIFKSGTVEGPSSVVIDLEPLSPQINEDGFCLLKLEAVERYPDPKDKNQFREVPLGGVFFVEALAPGYIAHPPKSAIGWCAKIGRTTKGRTYLKVIDADECD